MTSKLLASTLIAAALLVPFRSADAAEFNPAQKAEIEQVLRDYLLQNPEFLAEVQQAYELKQRVAEQASRTAALTQMAQDVFRLPGDAVLGSNDAKISIVEFLDYNCGWCKRSMGEVAKLIETDKDVRVVFKEFPIFGEGSEYAAKAALAAQKQGKYWELHQALFSAEQQVTAEVVDTIANGIGINIDQMKKDMEAPDVVATLAKNQELAQSLLLSGTPAFIIDQEIFPGYIPHTKIVEALQQVRSAGGCKIC